MRQPIRTYWTVMYGQSVLVKVYAPYRQDTVQSMRCSGLDMDVDAYAASGKEATIRQRKIDPTDIATDKEAFE